MSRTVVPYRSLLRTLQLGMVILSQACWLDSEGAMHPSILLFVGDEQVRWETPWALEANETVTFLSPISGG